MRADYEKAIRAGRSGDMIRTSRIINHLHEFVIGELQLVGISHGYIRAEAKIQGYFKPKTQDILVARVADEPLISINIRSQLSSVQ